MSTLLKSRIAQACLLLAACAALPAHAGLFDDDEARKAIVDLRTRFDALGAQLRDTNTRLDTKSDRTAALDLLNQNERLMQELAKLRGDIELRQNELAEMARRQKELYSDLDERLRKLEPGAKAEGEAAADSSAAQPDQSAFEAAQGQFAAGNYKGAATALSAFLQSYPDSNYAAPAQHLLGNAFFALGDYKRAIAAQEAVLASFKDSPQVPHALLNIASSHIALNDAEAARKTLADLVKRYPDSSAAPEARARLAELKPAAPAKAAAKGAKAKAAPAKGKAAKGNTKSSAQKKEKR
jgi:tol-pal system protein YbgF